MRIDGDRALATWIRVFALDEVRQLAPLARERLLSGFREKESEARAAEEKAWSEYVSQSGGAGEDADEASMDAMDEGVDLLRVLSSMEQATRNLLAAGLFHLFEQQKQRYESFAELWASSVAPFNKTFQSWRKVDELRQVANVAKHGPEGEESRELQKQRPELFTNPILRKLGAKAAPSLVRSPMVGEGLYVEEADLIEYQKAIEGLWNEIADFHEKGGLEGLRTKPAVPTVSNSVPKPK